MILSSCSLSPAGPDVKELKLQAEELIEWNLVRGEHFAEVAGQFERILPPASTTQITTGAGSKKRSSPAKWLSNVEVATHSAVERPIWMGPQFVFKTFQASDSPDTTTNTHHDGEAVVASFHDEDLNAEDDPPSKLLEFRTAAPVPYKEDPFDNDPGVSVYSMSPKELAENLTDALEHNMGPHFLAMPSGTRAATSSQPTTTATRRRSKDERGGERGVEKDLDFEDDALVVGAGSFKDEWDLGQSAQRGGRRHTKEESSGDEFESLARETIGSPDGDNELAMPAGSVFLG